MKTNHQAIAILLVVAGLAGCGADVGPAATQTTGQPQRAKGFAELGESYRQTDRSGSERTVELVDVALLEDDRVVFRSHLDGVAADTTFDSGSSSGYGAIIIEPAHEPGHDVSTERLEIRSYPEGMQEVWYGGQMLAADSEAVTLMPEQASKIHDLGMTLLLFVGQRHTEIGWSAARRAMSLDSIIKGGQMACRRYPDGTIRSVPGGGLQLQVELGC